MALAAGLAGSVRAAQAPPPGVTLQSPPSGASLDVLLTTLAQPLRLSNGNISGAGADSLRVHMARASWTVFGEQHNVRGLPEIVAAALHSAAADALALEMGPWIAELLDVRPAREVLAFAPYSIAFDDDGEITLLEVADSLGAGLAIWGLDQEFSAIQPLRALADSGLRAIDRRTARGLHLTAVLRAGGFIREQRDESIAALRRASWRDSAWAHRTIDALAASQEIYALHRGGEPARSAALRERYLYERFAGFVAAFTAREGRVPRVVTKIGGAHVIAGTRPNGVPSLTEELRVLADSLGVLPFTIGIRRFDRERSALPLAAAFELLRGQVTAGGAPGAGAETVHALFVDAAPLREVLPTLADSVRAAIAADVMGFDALVYIAAEGPPENGLATDARGAFRAQALRTMVLAFLPVPLVVLLAVVMVLVVAFRKPSSSFPTRLLEVGVALATLVLPMLVAAQLWQWRTGSPGTTWPCHSWLPFALPLVAGAVSAGLWTVQRNAGRWHQLLSLTSSVLLLWLAWSATYWNVGASLGCGAGG